MRLPHHLLRHKSGVFYFRLIVPRDLQAVFGKKVIKRSLGVRDMRLARAYAYELGAQYAHAIADARGKRMGSKDWQVSTFEIDQRADGSLAMRTDGSEQDNAAALEALRLLKAMRRIISPQPRWSMRGSDKPGK